MIRKPALPYPPPARRLLMGAALSLLLAGCGDFRPFERRSAQPAEPPVAAIFAPGEDVLRPQPRGAWRPVQPVRPQPLECGAGQRLRVGVVQRPVGQHQRAEAFLAAGKDAVLAPRPFHRRDGLDAAGEEGPDLVLGHGGGYADARLRVRHALDAHHDLHTRSLPNSGGNVGAVRERVKRLDRRLSRR